MDAARRALQRNRLGGGNKFVCRVDQVSFSGGSQPRPLLNDAVNPRQVQVSCQHAYPAFGLVEEWRGDRDGWLPGFRRIIDGLDVSRRLALGEEKVFGMRLPFM